MVEADHVKPEIDARRFLFSIFAERLDLHRSKFDKDSSRRYVCD